MPGFKIAQGTLAALSGMEDNRAYYIFDGDLNQMGIIYTTLLRAGFPVVKNNVYPGFPKNQEDKYKEALKYLFENRIEGWWSQRSKLLEYKICTEEEFKEALDKV